MTFEESFPSLKGKSGQYGMGESVNVFDIEACCLDKERLREVIKSELMSMHDRFKHTGKHCHYKTPKEEAVALCVRIMSGFQLLTSKEIIYALKELGLE